MIKKDKIMKVFIVEDSPLLRERLIAMLSELPEVEIVGQAQGALQAINSISTLTPDVVILDIRMQGGSGIDVLRQIRKEKSGTTVIILTNYPYPQYRDMCMKAGADFFFDKSAEFEKIPGVLRELIRERHV